MTSEDRKVAKEIARWVRVGALTLSVLGPVINTVSERLRERAETLREASAQSLAQSQSKLADTLTELKDAPYSQELLKRGEGLVEQGGKLSQVLVERGSKVTHELAERGEKLSHDLSKRSKQVTKQVSKSGNKARKLAERNSTALAIAGFSVGLTAAGIAAFILIRRRLQQDLEQEEHFELSPNGNLNGSLKLQPVETLAAKPSTNTPIILQAPTPLSVPVTPVATETEVQTQIAQPVPVDAAFFGLVSTKRYYPVATPLDQLETTGNQALDIIYFASEDEAKVQGFLPAE